MPEGAGVRPALQATNSWFDMRPPQMINQYVKVFAVETRGCKKVAHNEGFEVSDDFTENPTSWVSLFGQNVIR